MQKLKLTQKEVEVFAENFQNGNIETEVISNLCRELFRKGYDDLLKEMDRKKLTNNEKMTILSFREVFGNYSNTLSNFESLMNILDLYLENEYGKEDFIIEGNRIYKNYLFEHKGLVLILSNKSEYQTNNQIMGYRPLLVAEAFKEIMQNLVNFIRDNPNKVDGKLASLLIKSGIEKGEISEDYQIVYPDVDMITINQSIPKNKWKS